MTPPLRPRLQRPGAQRLTTPTAHLRRSSGSSRPKRSFRERGRRGGRAVGRVLRSLMWVTEDLVPDGLREPIAPLLPPPEPRRELDLEVCAVDGRTGVRRDVRGASRLDGLGTRLGTRTSPQLSR